MIASVSNSDVRYAVRTYATVEYRMRSFVRMYVSGNHHIHVISVKYFFQIILIKYKTEIILNMNTKWDKTKKINKNRNCIKPEQSYEIKNKNKNKIYLHFKCLCFVFMCSI